MSKTRVVRLPEWDRVQLKAGAMKRAVMAGGQVIEAYAKINTTHVFSSRATQSLAGSIQTVITKERKTRTEAATGPTVIYGRIQELGGWIKPVTAKMLHWVEEGVDIFAKAVYIPPRPYLRPAADEHESDILKAVGASLKADIEGEL